MKTSWSKRIGSYCGCLSSSISRSPRPNYRCVAGSRSEPNWAKAASSRNCDRSPFSVLDALLMAFVWALEPTRDTDRPALMAGRWPALNRSVSRNNCPSVMEMTLVGI